MKSRTSFFKTAVKKDLTRFAPAWILYMVCLLLGMLLMAEGGLELGFARSFADCIQVMSIVNLAYGLLTSQLLLGDLFNSRLCFGLHVLPIRRDDWLGAHWLSGIFFSLVPTAVMTAISIPLVLLSNMEKSWQLPLYWFLAVNLQYLFFFGFGTFTMLLSGNRFGAALIYGIGNFAAILVYYMVDTVYLPLLFGFVGNQDPFILFSPVVQFTEFSFIGTNSIREFAYFSELGESVYRYRGNFALTENWWYLWVCAGVGLVFGLLGLLIYRSRDLERAGDLMATRKIEPVFLVAYSLFCATVCHFVAADILGFGGHYILMAVGLVAGWFTGRMLLKRSTRVFGKKAWPGLLALCAAVAVSLGLTVLDPLNLEERIPEREEIVSVSLYQYPYDSRSAKLTREEDIETVLRIHEKALEERLAVGTVWINGQRLESVPFTADRNEVYRAPTIYLTYQLKNGSRLTRTYRVNPFEEDGLAVRTYFSDLSYVLPHGKLIPGDLEEFIINGCAFSCEDFTEEDGRTLVEAIRADSEAGALAQDSMYYSREPVVTYTRLGELYQDHTLWMDMMLGGNSYSFQIYTESEHTMQWLRQRGLLDEYIARQEQ